MTFQPFYREVIIDSDDLFKVIVGVMMNCPVRILVLLPLFCFTGCASTSSQTQQAKPADEIVRKNIVPAVQKTPKIAKKKLVCRKESVVGSHFNLRICKSAAQWDAEREHSREDIEEILRRSEPRIGQQQ